MLSIGCLILLLLGAMVSTVVAVVWSRLYARYLEPGRPAIEVVELPAGIGITPVSMKFQLTDPQAGLDEVVIRTRQKGITKERLRQGLGGKARALVSLDFDGEHSGLDEGIVELEVRVFDRSFWSNSRQETYSLRVDYHKPKIQVLSPQHNARLGGSQLIFYQASDDDLAISGVRVGDQTFAGYPARGLDPQFEDPSLFAAVYAADIRQPPDPSSVRAFATDRAGNINFANFYNRIQPRTRRLLQIKLNDDFLRSIVLPMAESNKERLAGVEQSLVANAPVDSVKPEHEQLVEKFKLVNQTLREVNEADLVNLLKGPRFESYWHQAFLLPVGTVQSAFGDTLVYILDGQEIGRRPQYGYEIVLSNAYREVSASNEGIVIFSDNLGVYGRCMAIDHGFGVVSLYAHLDQILVRKGETVARGQKIALAGTSGFSRNTNLYFEMRVHGVPVDPTEWWEEGWFYAHITAKINDMKKMLGIPVYSP